jgi:hypothetical protein
LSAKCGQQLASNVWLLFLHPSKVTSTSMSAKLSVIEETKEMNTPQTESAVSRSMEAMRLTN